MSMNRVGEIGLPGSPGEILGIERDAVSAHPRAWIEGLETEWFGGGGIDHLPHVDTKLVTELGDLVDQPDVDRPICVLEELAHLGSSCRAHPVDGRHESPVGGLGHVTGRWSVTPPTTFGMSAVFISSPGDTRSGEKATQTSSSSVSPAAATAGTRKSSVVPGIGGRLQADQLPRASEPGDRVSGSFDVGEVGLTIAPQRARDTDENGVGLRQDGGVGGESGSGLDGRRQRFVGHVVDMGPPR